MNCNVCGREYRVWKSHYRHGIYKQCSKECRDKTRVSPFDSLIRRTDKYRKWHSLVTRRDGNKCQACGITDVGLHVHHEIGFARLLHRYGIRSVEQAINCTQLWNVKNGVSLCLQCHIQTPNYGNRKH